MFDLIDWLCFALVCYMGLVVFIVVVGCLLCGCLNLLLCRCLGLLLCGFGFGDWLFLILLVVFVWIGVCLVGWIGWFGLVAFDLGF